MGDALEYPQNIWFDGGWDNPQIDNPAIIRGLSICCSYVSRARGYSPMIGMKQEHMQQNLQHSLDASLFGPWFESDESPSQGNIGYTVIPPQTVLSYTIPHRV